MTSGGILTLYDWLNNFCCFSAPVMVLAFNAINGHGLVMKSIASYSQRRLTHTCAHTAHTYLYKSDFKEVGATADTYLVKESIVRPHSFWTSFQKCKRSK